MRKKVSVTIGMLILIIGMGMNVQYALAEYGITENALPVMVLSQSGSGGGSGTSLYPQPGHQGKDHIKCSVTVDHGGSSSTTTEISGDRFYCLLNNYVEVCYNYDPCAGFYQ